MSLHESTDTIGSNSIATRTGEKEEAKEESEVLYKS